MNNMKIVFPTSEKFIEALPIITVPRQKRMSSSCSICGEKLSETITWLPCDHCFHKACIVPSLRRSNACPICHRLVPAVECSEKTKVLAALMAAMEKEDLLHKRRLEQYDELVKWTDQKASSLPCIRTCPPRPVSLFSA